MIHKTIIDNEIVIIEDCSRGVVVGYAVFGVQSIFKKRVQHTIDDITQKSLFELSAFRRELGIY
jgi:hypothetical protein